MYLKRLDLQGFKSFHTHTTFEFGPGITAVVGPNGSGKSNVGESLRWVLGEQQSRSIRARRLEDVIFSGSSQRAAVGMAEVSITLDNAEGWLPVDYTEVVVSRRAYRNGDSEYLINKSKVRLRDVLDLFLRAQVGQNSYAFMGQGLVEEVLLMRPEERRRLLEEAADVRLLRTRLDEARDRLAATKENLERVNLLIDEIAPRLRQLERQASRAADHARLAQELFQTLRELYSLQWHEAQEALSTARAAFEQRQQELVLRREALQACEDGLTALTTAVEERQKELSSRRTQQRSLADQVHVLEQRIRLDKERLETQTRRRAEIEAELQSLQNERADLQRTMAAAQERVRAIQPEIEETKALVLARRQDLTALEQEQSALRRSVGETEDRLDRAKRGALEAERGLNRLKEEQAKLQGESARRLNQKREILYALVEIGKSYKELRDHSGTVESELEAAETERNQSAAIVESARSAVFSLESEAMTLAGRVAQLKGQRELLNHLQAAQEGVEAGARYLLGDEATRRDAAEGLICLVRDVVRVPPGLEQAIEAALAENVGGLVFESLPSALAALDVLSQREAGRALMFPLDSVRATPPLNLMRERGIIGVAAKLVRCDNRYRPLVDGLLGRTIVVEASMTLAREVLRRGLGPVVTIDGVLLRPSGAISGGVTRAATEAYSRQRELDELPEQIEAAAAQQADVEQRLRREREDLAEATAALAEVEPRLAGLREEVLKLQRAYTENRSRLIRVRSQARGLWSELARGEAEMDWRGRSERLSQERDKHLADATQLEETLKRDRGAVSVLASKRNEAIDAVSGASAAHADLEGEAKSLARQLELLVANLARSENGARGREETLRSIDAELVSLRSRGETDDTDLYDLRQNLAVLVSEVEPAEGEFNHLAGREKAMREQLSAARSALLAGERAFLEAESAVKLRGDEIEALAAQIAGEGFRTEGDGVVAAAAPPAPAPSNEHPPVRGGAEVSVEGLRTRVTTLRNQIRALGPVNEQAAADYGESKERHDFLKGQVDDLAGSEATLLGAIDELENNIRERLKATFAVVDAEFQRYFEAFFGGGSAHLGLTQPDDFANTGIEIVAQPPGKRVNTLAMLSGGERALTSLALLLSLLQAHPSPICVLDEVDAALDERNVGRFVDALKALEQKTQFIIITHNPRTIEAADDIYGVSMGSDSTSKVLSMRLSDVKQQA